MSHDAPGVVSDTGADVEGASLGLGATSELDGGVLPLDQSPPFLPESHSRFSVLAIFL